MKLARLAAVALGLGLVLASCNVFNPSGDGEIPTGDADGFILQGQEDLRNRNFPNAESNFKKALALDSTKSLAWHGLGKSYVGTLPMDSILSSFEKLTKNKDSLQNPFTSASWSLIREIFRPMGRMTGTYAEFIRRDSLHLTDGTLSSDGDLINYTVGKTLLLALSTRVLLPANADSTDSLLMDTSSTLSKLASQLSAALNVDSLSKGNASSIATSIASLAMDCDTAKDSAHTVTCKTNDTVVAALNAKLVAMSSDLSSLQSAATSMGVNVDSSDTNSSSGKLKSQAQSFVTSNPDAVKLVQFADRLDNDGNGCVDEKISDGRDGVGDGVPGDYRLGSRDSSMTPHDGLQAISFTDDSLDDSRLVDFSRGDTLVNGQYLNKGIKGIGTTSPLIYADTKGHLKAFRKYWDSTQSDYAEKHWKRNLEWGADSAVSNLIPVYPADTSSSSLTKGSPATASILASNSSAKSDLGRILTTEELIKIRLRILSVTDKCQRWQLGRKYVGGCWKDVTPPSSSCKEL